VRLYFAVVAAVFIAGSIWLVLRRSIVALSGVSASGRVVAFERREDDGSIYYLPIVEFTDRQGVLRRFTAVAGGAKQRPTVGATITVRYLPEKPELVFIVSFLHMWAAPMGMLVLGIGALVACLRW
jgi:hypothetical protein